MSCALFSALNIKGLGQGMYLFLLYPCDPYLTDHIQVRKVIVRKAWWVLSVHSGESMMSELLTSWQAKRQSEDRAGDNLQYLAVSIDFSQQL